MFLPILKWLSFLLILTTGGEGGWMADTICWLEGTCQMIASNLAIGITGISLKPHGYFLFYTVNELRIHLFEKLIKNYWN